jgi:hypothetical protein
MRVPEKEELPKFQSVTLPVTSSPSTAPLNSSVSGIGNGHDTGAVQRTETR